MEKDCIDYKDISQYITIPMEEYKELLIIKGKYEELKSNQTLYPTYPSWSKITYRGENDVPINPYTFTCHESMADVDCTARCVPENP